MNVRRGDGCSSVVVTDPGTGLQLEVDRSFICSDYKTLFSYCFYGIEFNLEFFSLESVSLLLD